MLLLLLLLLMMKVACEQEAERRQRRAQVEQEQEEREVRERERAGKAWDRELARLNRERIPTPMPRPVALQRQDTGVVLNLRRDAQGDAGKVCILGGYWVTSSEGHAQATSGCARRCWQGVQPWGVVGLWE